MGYGYELFQYVYMGILIVAGAPLALMALAVPYIVLRSRDGRQEVQDPQLGLKTALHLIGSIGIVIGITGFTFVVTEILMRDSTSSTTWFTPLIRAGLGMILSGLIITAGNWWFLLMRTNDRQWPAVRRTFVGSRLVIHGIVICITLTGTLVALFLDDAPEEIAKVFGGSLLVWFASWAVHFALMIRYTRQSPSPSHAGLCEHCGYDLRGSITHTSRNCPECGNSIGAAMRTVILRQREDMLGAPTPGSNPAPGSTPAAGNVPGTTLGSSLRPGSVREDLELLSGSDAPPNPPTNPPPTTPGDGAPSP